MATLQAKVLEIDNITPHDNAERLEIAHICGYQAVIAKGAFSIGEKAIYIPVDAILPDDLIDTLGLTGKLAGPHANRVKTVKLRGVISQGVVMKTLQNMDIGTDVTEELGITKYVPELPSELIGEVYAIDSNEAFTFDIENIKSFPNVIQEGEIVTITEKVHGVFMVIGAHPDNYEEKNPKHRGGQAFISSKGLFSDRAAFITDTATPNVYVRAEAQNGLMKIATSIANEAGKTIFLMGEVFGAGVQDLSYGQTKGELGFRLFSIAHKEMDTPRFWDNDKIEETAEKHNLNRVPVLYTGPFSKEVMELHTNGKESLSGNSLHIREGVIITPVKERFDTKLGRVCLKSVSNDYLVRKGGTEFS